MKPLRAWTYDVWIMAALAAFGAGVFVMTFAIDTSTASAVDVGPRFVPRVFAAALMLCALWALLAKSREREHDPIDSLVFVTMGIAIAYALLLPKLGYIASTTLMLGILLFAVRAGTWWKCGAFALGMTAFTYLIFERVLLVGLPAGPWGF